MRNRLLYCAVAALLVTGCSSGRTEPDGSSSTSSPAPPATTAEPTNSPSPTPAPSVQTKSWFDLQVGDCVSAIPQVDLGEVTVSIVTCSQAHQAEVYLRTPVEVNAAIADVADRDCNAGIAAYTGLPADDGRYAVSYLIDSNQDRTVDNPLPSTVICLLQARDGEPLRGSAHR